MTERLSSTRNQFVLDAVALHRSAERRKRQLTLIEGPKLLEEALSTGNVPQTVFALGNPRCAQQAEVAGARVVEVTAHVLQRLSTTKNPQDPVSVVAIPPSTEALGDRVAVLVDISDPGNVGTLIRSAASFSLDVVVAGDQAADPWSPKALRAGAGAQFRTGVKVIRDVSALRDSLADRVMVASVVNAGASLDSFRWPRLCAILIGSEAHGLAEPLVGSCEVAIEIELANAVESLNAAAAGSIIFHAMSLAQHD
jgi:TrmH family RNA methyltransferase